MPRSQDKDPLFGLLAHEAVTSDSTKKYASTEVKRSIVKGRLQWRIVFTKESHNAFGSLPDMKPYQLGHYFEELFTEKAYSDFAAFCRFSNGSQLRSEAALTGHMPATRGGSPIGKNGILRQELRTKAKAAGFTGTDEQISNMYLHSIQQPSNPAITLLTAIKKYFSKRGTELLQESAFVGSTKLAPAVPTVGNVQPPPIPRCTITPISDYLGVPGFLQEYHTQYHTVNFSKETDFQPIANPQSRDKADCPWVDIYILVFVPLIPNANVVPLATVVTANGEKIAEIDTKLEAVMNTVFIGMLTGDLNGIFAKIAQEIAIEAARAGAAAAQAPSITLPSVGPTVRAAPRFFTQLFTHRDLFAFGLRNKSASHKQRCSYFNPDVKRLKEPEIRQAYYELNRDMPRVGSVLFPTQTDVEASLADSPKHTREKECYEQYIASELQQGLVYKDPHGPAIFALQVELLSRLKQAGFRYTDTQLLNLCILVSQNTHNWLKTLATGIRKLFGDNNCELATVNPKGKAGKPGETYPCHTILPVENGFLYDYHVYYTVADVVHPNGKSETLGNEIDPLISIYIRIKVPLHAAPITGIIFTLDSHTPVLNPFAKAVVQDIKLKKDPLLDITQGALITWCEAQIAEDQRTAAAKAARAAQEAAASAASAQRVSRPRHLATSGNPQSGEKRKRDGGIFSPFVDTGQTGLTPVMAAAAMASPATYAPLRGGKMRQPDFDQSLTASGAAASPLATPLPGPQFVFPPAGERVPVHSVAPTPRSTPPTKSSPLATPLGGSPSHTLQAPPMTSTPMPTRGGEARSWLSTSKKPPRGYGKPRTPVESPWNSPQVPTSATAVAKAKKRSKQTPDISADDDDDEDV